MANILIVDDDKAILQQLETMINSFGHTPIPTVYATHVLDILDNEIVDLVLTDVYMPEIDGLHILKQLKAHQQYHSIPVIVLTSDTDEKMLDACFEAGAVDFITKPLREVVLRARMKSALNNKWHIEELKGVNTELQNLNDKRKDALSEIKTLNEELERKVKARTKTLYESKQDLEKSLEELNITQQQLIQSEKLGSLGTVIAGFTHEINNSLMGVINYVQYVSEHTKEKKLQDYLKMAEQEAKRSSDIAGKLLNYSRPTKPDCTAINCKDVVKQVLGLLDLNFDSNNIKVTVNIPDTLPAVWAKQDSLQQVFLNLLINARDAMANSPRKEVYIDGSHDGNNAQITVQDTGPGIPPEIIRQIFDPFFTTKEPGKGTGLGLSVSYNIIASLRGKLDCESSDGQGTKFIITLPVNKDQ